MTRHIVECYHETRAKAVATTSHETFAVLAVTIAARPYVSDYMAAEDMADLQALATAYIDDTGDETLRIGVLRTTCR